jgi:hypothetical protein
VPVVAAVAVDRVITDRRERAPFRKEAAHGVRRLRQRTHLRAHLISKEEER